MGIGGLVFAVLVLLAAATIFIRRRQGMGDPPPRDKQPLRPPLPIPDFEPAREPGRAAPEAASSETGDGARAAAAGALVVGYMAAHTLDDSGGGDTPEADDAGESDGDSGGDGGDGGGGDGGGGDGGGGDGGGGDGGGGD